MTELRELAALLADAEKDNKQDKCPICGKDKHAKNEAKDPNEVPKVVSKPSNLKVKKIKRSDGPLPYTTAAHHLISAKQCYAQITRLVRIGNICEYDINSEANGIGLPTTHYRLLYPHPDGVTKKYGDFDDYRKKKEIAEPIMKEYGGQWHVGHHAVTIVTGENDVLSQIDNIPEGGADETEDGGLPHETAYDEIVLRMLLNLLKSLKSTLCDKTDDERNAEFRKEMDKVSQDIEKKLNHFESGKNRADSHPFFVSALAYEYAGGASHLKHKGTPIRNTSK